MTTRTLVVCADDLGLHPAVDEGIAAACEHGVLRAASLLVTGASVDGALALASALPTLSVGVHLSLLDVPPAGDPTPWRPLLDDRGCFPPSAGGRGLAAVVAHALRHPADALAEFRAQLARAAALGVTPTHVDGHNHLHLLPGLAGGVARLCAELGVAWLRTPRAPARRWRSRRWRGDRGGWKGTAVRLCGRRAARGLPAGVRAADHVLGLGWTGRGPSDDELAALPGRLQPGVTEWMAHPVADDDDFARRFPWGAGWGRERAALCDAALADGLERAGVRVAGFGTL